VKWELEDFSFRYTEPELYKKIAQLLDEKRNDREAYIQRVIARLHGELEGMGIPPRSRAGPSTSIRSGERCAARTCRSSASTTSARCA
jgi:GTP pyrophosphokinase